MTNPPLLSVKDLHVEFRTRSGGRSRTLHAVKGVSFDIERGATFGLVGESGSGKSTTARAVVGLLRATAGEILLDGQRIDPSQMSRLQRRRVQMVFQDPHGSLNPRATVLRSLATPLVLHGVCTRREAAARAGELLRDVGLSADLLARHPGELSGGQRQRVGIARALAVEPSLVICDEPVSALDVSVRSQIMRLLAATQEEHDLTYLFIAHDLAVVAQISARIGVMYLGSIVEVGDRDEVLHAARHPYTRALVSAQPVPDPTVERMRPRIVLHGDLPSPYDPPSGCAFRTRCPLYAELDRPTRCAEEPPVLAPLAGDHAVACHFHDQEQLTAVTVASTTERLRSTS